MNTYADSAKTNKRETTETTEEQKQSETGKTASTNYRHSVAGSYRTEAATSLCNKLQMRRHYKAMLMRPASALWDCHPRSVNVNTAALSSNVHLRAWRGMEEAERNNNQHLPPSFAWDLSGTTLGLFTLNIVFTFTSFLLLVCLISNTIFSSVYVTELSVNIDGLIVKGLIWLKTALFQRVVTLTKAQLITILTVIFFSYNNLSISHTVTLK